MRRRTGGPSLNWPSSYGKTIRVARELHSLNVQIEQFAAKSAGQLRQLLVVCVRAGMQLSRQSRQLPIHARTR
jgi:hypothetical protein